MCNCVTYIHVFPLYEGEGSLPEIAQLREDLKTLESQLKQLGGNHDSVNSTVQQLHQNVNEMEQKIEGIQTQMTNHQQKIEESIQIMATNVESALQKASDVQKSNEELQRCNTNLMNQLSLTQKQLFGVQSMMTCGRLWVISHDQFAIGREIGRGAWATVHETTFRGTKVAAKRLHDLITADGTKRVFQREMEMALQCQHQNIVTFLGATLEGTPVILMELMDTSLRNAYEKGKIKDHQVLGILHDIACALHFLHTRPDPVIHRDVSSANVLLKALYNDQWLAKLGDLGTAKIQRLTTTAGPGAVIYSAPEAADGSRHSPKMDVYSFGVLVPETLTKTLPYENLDTLKVQVKEQFPQYHQLVTSCTNRQLSDRPTMYEVIKMLDRIKASS